MGILPWRQVAQCAVRAHLVIVPAPFLDDPSGLSQAAKPVFVQTFVPELAVEALDEGILRRLARSGN